MQPLPLHWLQTVTADILFRAGQRASCASSGTAPRSTDSSNKVSRGLPLPSHAQIAPSHPCLPCSQRRLDSVHPCCNAENAVALSRQRAGSPPHQPARSVRGRLGHHRCAQTSSGHHVGVLFQRWHRCHWGPAEALLASLCIAELCWRALQASRVHAARPRSGLASLSEVVCHR